MIPHDEFGPEKILEVYDPKTGMRGVLVIDSTALGPGKGGIRMTPTVGTEEVYRLARTMTWKNAMAELPFGGAKSGITYDPKNAKADKASIIRAFSRALKPVCPSLYIAGPDVNTTEKEMAEFVKANGQRKSATGKPKSLGGLPHELGSTGFGVFHSTAVALRHKNLDLQGTRIAIEGFGNVGSFAAKFFAQAGAKIIAVSDSKGCIYDPQGLDYKQLERCKSANGTVTSYRGMTARLLPNENLFELETDVLIPAALPDVINVNNVNKVRAKIVVEGANIPMREDIEEMLHRRGILVVPDFVANAGGVISSFAEHKGRSEEQMFKLVEKKIVKNTKAVLDESRKRQMLPRHAAIAIAQYRVREAMKKREIRKA